MVLVDLQTGQVTPIDVDIPPSWTSISSSGRVTTAFHPFGWRLQDERLIVGGSILDLTGRQTGSVPLAENAVPVDVRPDGEGLLIRPQRWRLDSYALVDWSGAVTRQLTIQECQPYGGANRLPDALCTAQAPAFAGWRGTGQILLRGPDRVDITNSAVPSDLTEPIVLDAVDLGTGGRHRVHHASREPRLPAAVVISADGLSAELRDKLSF
ncbi:hypothetical protein [Phytohabitans kaempferiae]|uniref:Uncharacterized protein n=1 Tax=Phytohabitans kaempferiae TaxID=1620943 RepID=A0ABV6M3F3_9ACTN